jgi:preprotein translocase subunit SecE
MSPEVKLMETKKTQQTSTANALTQKKVQKFVAEMKSEIQKVEWTNKSELITYTKIVVLATFALGMAIYCMDLMIQGALGVLNFLLRFFVG